MEAIKPWHLVLCGLMVLIGMIILIILGPEKESKFQYCTAPSFTHPIETPEVTCDYPDGFPSQLQDG